MLSWYGLALYENLCRCTLLFFYYRFRVLLTLADSRNLTLALYGLLAVSVACPRRRYLGYGGRWNLFDIAVVAVAAVEEILKLISGKRVDSNLTSLRLLRILKIARVIRVVRVVRLFRELRIMFMSIISTLRTLCWSFVCVLLIMSVVAAYIAAAASEYVAVEGEDEEDTMYFGSMPRTMISLFQANTNGIDWRNLSDVLGRASKIAQAMLFAYISVMVYLVMNILTGICVTTANKSAEDDLDYTIHQELAKRNNVVENLKIILYGDDECNNGNIQWHELQRHHKSC